MKTITGRGTAGALRRSTETVRQSSDIGVLRPAPATSEVRGWGGTGPYSPASRTSVHGAGGRGARDRSSPAGVAAYGIPRQEAMPPRRRPRTGPLVVETTRAGSAAAGRPAPAMVPV